MNLTPRASEVAAVLSLLDATDPIVLVGACEADDRKALAKVLIKTVWASLMDRDFCAYGFRFESGALSIPFGPFTSASEAERFGKRAAFGRGDHRVVKLYAPAPVDRLAERFPAIYKEATT